MSYETVEKQIKELPEEALEELSVYIEKISGIYKSKKSVDFSFVENIFGILSDKEAEHLRSSCGACYKQHETFFPHRKYSS